MHRAFNPFCANPFWKTGIRTLAGTGIDYGFNARVLALAAGIYLICLRRIKDHYKSKEEEK